MLGEGMIKYDKSNKSLGSERILLSPIDVAREVRRALQSPEVHKITIQRLEDNTLIMLKEEKS